MSDLPKKRLAAAELRGLEEYPVGVAASGCERCGVFEIRRHDLQPRVGAVGEYLRVSGDRANGMFFCQRAPTCSWPWRLLAPKIVTCLIVIDRSPCWLDAFPVRARSVVRRKNRPAR